jgi:2-polyprenyl-6-methoxyphenol hydroxylase-like FAD-dependent oxidoreductase
MATGTALVVGGGIGGCAAALFLARTGMRVTLFEAQPAPRDEVGAFLNLAPNGMAVLTELGLADRARTAGTPTDGIEFRNHRGRRLGRNPEQLLLIKRGTLNRVLRAAVEEQGIAIEFGRRLTGVHDHGRQVTVTFADGSTASGDLLVGCDGIHSATRRAILPQAPAPRYTGLVGTGGFVRSGITLPPSATMYMTFGLRAFFGYQVTPWGEIYWFQNTPAEQPPAKDDPQVRDRFKDVLRDLHRDDHYPVPQIIAASDGGIGLFPIYDLETLPAWYVGRTALLGDAAHVMGPHSGQGASMALEDAMVLAAHVRDNPGRIEAALAGYEAERRPRVEHVVRLTRHLGNTKSPGPMGRVIRDLMLPIFLPMGVKTTAKIYHSRPDWATRRVNTRGGQQPSHAKAA